LQLKSIIQAIILIKWKKYTAVSIDEKTMQRKFFFWYKEENKNVVKNYLAKIKRLDISRALFR
jgi:hypothetical protein